ncbi:MAG: flagellar motor protein MotB [Rhodospirillales bacterium]|jgi:chemotaxis protein MotB|nr:flagellar motor protein MotB [Rhodospirillales bacterium]
MADQQSVILIKKVVKGGHGHHGGAWKVAYADFVTAMMAFFLLLWLLNAVSQDQLEGISSYFAPVSVSESTSGSGGVLGGTAMSSEGVQQSGSASPMVAMDLPPPQAGSGPEEDQDSEEDVSEGEAEKVLQEKEEEQFKEAEKKIQEALKSLPELEQLAKGLKIDSTPEGLRVQIIDQEGLAMFPRGGAQMSGHTRKALSLVAKVIERMPQDISITGHTDATKFAGARTGYTNWELSADRANASRRALIDDGLEPGRLSRVVGAADKEPYDIDDPAGPSNRRIAIVLLRGTGRQEDKKTETKEEAQEQSQEQSQEQPDEQGQEQPPVQPAAQ